MDSLDKVIDYNLNNVISIRLINPSEKDKNLVQKILGVRGSNLNFEPDIIINFKEFINLTGIKYIGPNSGYIGNKFFVLSNGNIPVKIHIPFEKIGQTCEIECESGSDDIPLLNHITNLTYLSKGYIPLHSSAISYQKSIILIMGWSDGGKTSTLLSLARNGAKFLGDDLLIISPDGKNILRTNVTIRISEWQFKYIPDLLPKISLSKKFSFIIIHILILLIYFVKKIKLNKIPPFDELTKLLPLLKKYLKIKVSPNELFGNNIENSSAGFDKIILTTSYNDKRIFVEKKDPIDIAKRMTYSNVDEFSYLLEYYNSFKYAFPSFHNDLIENLQSAYENALTKLFKDKQAYELFHPHHANFDDLFNGMESIFENKFESISE